MIPMHIVMDAMWSQYGFVRSCGKSSRMSEIMMSAEGARRAPPPDEGTPRMLFDESDNTVEICEGGVWVSLDDAAEQAGADLPEFEAWAKENLADWNDYLMDSIVDFAIEKIAELFRDNA
jgi:hypothetical protein